MKKIVKTTDLSSVVCPGCQSRNWYFGPQHLFTVKHLLLEIEAECDSCKATFEINFDVSNLWEGRKKNGK